MNAFEMVVLIVAIVSIASIMRAKHGILRDKDGNERPLRNPDGDRMREEIRALKERVAVLERIATDRGTALEREIDELR